MPGGQSLGEGGFVHDKNGGRSGGGVFWDEATGGSGGPQDGELRRFPPGLVGLQHLLDEPFDFPLRHPITVARLPEDVDALGQLVVDARLTHRRSHGSSGDGGLWVKRVDVQLLEAPGTCCQLQR